MKKSNIISLSVAFLFCITSMSAQFEVKINPIGLLFNSPDLSAEYIVSDEIGVELVLGLEYGKAASITINDEEDDPTKSGYKVRIAGKYYFGPEDGADRWYAGLYAGPRSRSVDRSFAGSDLGYKQSAFAAGLTAGFKWVGSSGIVFELGMGVGRAFNNKWEFNDSTNTTTLDGFGIDAFGKAALGYRF